MGFKKMNKEFSFADVVLESSKKHNRSIKNMDDKGDGVEFARFVFVF